MKKITDIIGSLVLSKFTPFEAKIMSETFIENVLVSLENRKLNIYLVSTKEIPTDTINKIENVFHAKLPETDINVYSNKLSSTTSLVKRSWNDFLRYVFEKAPAARMWLLSCNWKIDKGSILFYIEKSGIKFLLETNCHKLIQQYFSKKLKLPLKVTFKEKPIKEKDYLKEEERKIVQSIIKKNAKAYKKGSDIITDDFPNIIGDLINAEPVSINTVVHEISSETSSHTVTVEGQVFNIEQRELKNKTYLLSFGLTDFTNSLPVKIFIPKKKKAVLNKFYNEMWIKVRGKIEFNTYSQEYELIAYDVNKSVKPIRKDLSTEKRVELHLHTRYSSMDAISAPSEVIKLAKAFGHKAVAFTDHGTVQSFPEVYEAAKDSNVKPIYGIEAYIFDDQKPIMIKPPSIKLSDAVFVVVDIETTGLSFDTDEIIEIGAVKLVDGNIVDTFNSLIKPSRPLPANITNLTGITNDMVFSAPSIEEVLPSFLDFLGDDIFVAHNADFDAGFIRRECRRHNLEFKNKVLDTLALSKTLLTELKNHRLDTISKKFNINMGNHHRAVDDANTAAMILRFLIKRLQSGGIQNLAEINNAYHLSKGRAHLNAYHATILVKNQKGLKNLYGLVSESHIKHFYRNPRIPKSTLNSNREGLLIGTGCQAGELFQSLLKHASNTKIEDIINFYDFLEIQPLSNNKFLLDNGMVGNIEGLKKLNIKIYNLGKKYNKPVVLTGDVHFLNPTDEIYRKILLTAQGFRDADSDSKLYFKTTDEMMRECRYLGEKTAYEVVVENTNRIADKIEENIKPIPDKLYPPKIKGADEDVIAMTYSKAKQLYGNKLPEIVQNRLDKELNAIISNGYAVIYLISHKLVKKSLEDGYLVGSRGSVGSSLVATMCDITEVNPLPPHYLCPKCKKSIFIEDDTGIVGPDLPDKLCPECKTPFKKEGFNIPFEVFLGFEGDKVPDIDLNFSGEYQSKAHKYTEELFGEEHVFRAGTISTIAEKTAYGFVKAYLEETGESVSSAEMARLVSGITGVKRTTGQHPGGVMVVPTDMDIYDFSPIQFPANDQKSGVITTHFDYHSISSRLLKLDLLGHEDPTSIKMLEELTGLDAKRIPLDDKDTMGIFSSLKPLNLKSDAIGTTVGTLGVPEFGTRFVRQMLEDTRPTTFAELVRISGLSHGTDVWLNNAQDLIKANIATLKDVIATRDDIMNYLISKGIEPKTAFCIMEKVRKGKGLTSKEENLLLSTNGVDKWFIESCKKIKYLFPKAHAVAYVLMAFRIAFFKVHYPEAFYATYFSSRADDFDAEIILQGPSKVRETMKEISKKERDATAKEKSLFTVLEVANEMYLRGINFVPIDLYNSGVRRFKLTKNGILPPMISIQGLGIKAAKNIYRERKKKFTSVEDLRQRTKVTKNVIEILKKNGVLEGLQETDQISLF